MDEILYKGRIDMIQKKVITFSNIILFLISMTVVLSLKQLNGIQEIARHRTKNI